MKKLNGWQRLWIVITVLWSIFVISISIALKPDLHMPISKTKQDFILSLNRSDSIADNKIALKAFLKNHNKAIPQEKENGFLYIPVNSKKDFLYIVENEHNFNKAISDATLRSDGMFIGYFPYFEKNIINAKSFVKALNTHYKKTQEKARKTHHKEVLRHIFFTLLAIFMPSFIISIFVISIRWVWQGFRKSE